MEVDIQGKKLFIDGSYYIFYRFFATYNWYRRQNESDDLENKSENITEDKIFMEKYAKIFENTIVSLQKSNKIEWNNVFFAKDCPRQDIFRNDFYEGYKIREELKSFDNNIFVYTYNVLIPKLVDKYKFNILCSDKLEADDVIALLVKKIHALNATTKFLIITNDNDYVQLHNSVTEIKNLQDKDLKIRASPDYDAETYLKIKIILGDKSDNIPAIIKKCGIKTAEKLAMNPDELNKIFDKDPDAKKNFERNQRLIDFNYIDEKLKKEYLQKLKFV
jgi:5'-3' exonuclease